MKALLDAGADPNVTVEGAASPLFTVCALGNVNILQLLLERGVMVDQGHEVHGSPLHAAISMGHTDCVKELLQYGANVNVQHREYGNALQFADRGVYKCKSEIVDLLALRSISHAA